MQDNIALKLEPKAIQLIQYQQSWPQEPCSKNTRGSGATRFIPQIPERQMQRLLWVGCSPQTGHDSSFPGILTSPLKDRME